MEIEKQNQQKYGQFDSCIKGKPPFGNFRSTVGVVTDFDDVESKYNLNSHKREIIQF